MSAQAVRPHHLPDGKDAVMNRRWLAVGSGLIFTSSMAPTAWSQSSARPATLAERMSALRRGWSGGSQEQTSNDAPEAESGDTQTEGRSSATGNFLGRRPSQQQSAA